MTARRRIGNRNLGYSSVRHPCDGRIRCVRKVRSHGVHRITLVGADDGPRSISARACSGCRSSSSSAARTTQPGAVLTRSGRGAADHPASRIDLLSGSARAADRGSGLVAASGFGPSVARPKNEGRSLPGRSLGICNSISSTCVSHRRSRRRNGGHLRLRLDARKDEDTIALKYSEATVNAGWRSELIVARCWPGH